MILGTFIVFAAELILLAVGISKKYIRLYQAAYGALGLLAVSVTVKHRLSAVFEDMLAGNEMTDKAFLALPVIVLFCAAVSAAVLILRLIYRGAYLKKQGKNRISLLFEAVAAIFLFWSAFTVFGRLTDYDADDLSQALFGATGRFLFTVGIISALMSLLLNCVKEIRKADKKRLPILSVIFDGAGNTLLFIGVVLLCVQINNNSLYNKISGVTYVDDGSGSIIVTDGDFSQYFYMDSSMLDYFEDDENGDYYYYTKTVNGNTDIVRPYFIHAETVLIPCLLIGICLLLAGINLRKRIERMSTNPMAAVYTEPYKPSEVGNHGDGIPDASDTDISEQASI